MKKYSIDYSKWDRMVDSDDDDEDLTNRHKEPLVTVFDQPTRITFGGNNGSDNSGMNNISSQSSVAAKTDSDVKIPSNPSTSIRNDNLSNMSQNVAGSDATKVAATTPGKPIDSIDKNGIPLSWTENGTAIYHELDVTKQGEWFDKNIVGQQPVPNDATVDHPRDEVTTTTTPYKYFWSQDRSMIHVRIPIRSSNQTYKYHVNVSNLISYEDRHCATFTTDTTKQQLIVTHSPQQQQQQQQQDGNDDLGTKILFEGKLTYPVYVPEDYDDDEVDWSIQTHVHPSDAINDDCHNDRSESNEIANSPYYSCSSIEKYILITLYKATPMMGMTIWWKRCLTSEVTDIVANNTNRGSGNSKQQQQEFQKVWDEAHEQFQQTIHCKTKYSV